MARIRRSREEWFSIVQRCEASGISIKQFCLNEGIYQTDYYKWRKRYHGVDQGFAPILIGNPGAIKTLAGCELVYPNGVTLRLPSGVSASELSQFLRLF
jgi:hypothetical protein